MGKERIVALAMRAMQTIYVMLAVSLCVCMGFLPLEVLALCTHDVRAYPAFLAVAVLCSPALAAPFAVCRDHPALQVRARAAHTGARTPAWFARPYVAADRDAAVFLPFLRAWRSLWRRACLVSAVYALAAGVVMCDVQWCSGTPMGALMLPVAMVAGVLAVPAYAASLALVVEYPRATLRAVLRNGVVLSVRRGLASVPTLLVAAAYTAMAVRAPWLVVPLGTGVVAMVAWSDAHWQTLPLLEQCRAEERGKARI